MRKRVFYQVVLLLLGVIIGAILISEMACGKKKGVII